MTISQKNKRSVNVGGETYLWWVRPDDPLPSGSAPTSLCVASKTGDFYIKYFLGQPASTRHLEVIGRRFRKVVGCGSVHRRFLCPAISNEISITPLDIVRLIAWATDRSPDVEEVDSSGSKIAF